MIKYDKLRAKLLSDPQVKEEYDNIKLEYKGYSLSKVGG